MKICNPAISQIGMGTLVALFPGALYDSAQMINPTTQDISEEREYVQRYDDYAVRFSEKIPYHKRDPLTLLKVSPKIEESNSPSEDWEVEGSFLNPYAVGHMINHPPPGKRCNVIALDIVVPHLFFPGNLCRFVPNFKQIGGKETQSGYHQMGNRLLGVFAIEPIKDGEELFINYLELNLFSAKFIPDWCKSPPPLAPQFTKYQYESRLPLILEQIANSFVKMDEETIEALRRIKHDPEIDPFVIRDKKSLLESAQEAFKRR